MKRLSRLLVLLLLALLALQLFFAARIALMRFVDPQSTSFQRGEMRRILQTQGRLPWAQDWVSAERLGKQLPRAVIASEDAGFAEHGGLDWDAIREAWERNQRSQARAEKRGRDPAKAKIRGGSTISQQLAKNLFLSPEQNLARKAQEAAQTLMLELLLPKQRILEIYLNSVEWGEGVFGAQAAARHYFRTDAQQLSSWQAARLAVMLPAPKRYEKNPGSAFLSANAGKVAARMGAVALP